MRVLVTGANGFVGRNLVESLKCVSDGRDRRERYRTLLPLDVFECVRETPREQLGEWCAEADFVFHLAGANRPADPADFMGTNRGFTAELLELLERAGNACPVMLASSAQATLEGRYAGSAYGESKLAAEGLVFAHAERTGAKVLVYRLPNLYGKWCRPNYNSAVATFCHQAAHGYSLTVGDGSVELDLLYIDDLVAELMGALLGEETRGGGGFCCAGPVDRATVGEIADMLRRFASERGGLSVPDCSEGSFEKKLYATYLSHLDQDALSYGLRRSEDARGSFAELLRTPERGQVSVNVSRPSAVKGNHWHHTKWEKFLVVSGEALIRLRRVGADAEGNPFPVAEYRVSGDEPTVVEMAPGYTHSIANLSETGDLVTVMWANEPFDPERPDTFYEEV